MNFEQTAKTKTDKELLKMVYEFDQWSIEMQLAVENELKLRNKLPGDLIHKMEKLIKEERKFLTQPRAASLFGKILGWLTIFGFGGIFIGYNYAYSMVKSKYTDDAFPKYDEASRKMGKNMFYISILLTSFGLIYKLLTFE